MTRNGKLTKRSPLAGDDERLRTRSAVLDAAERLFAARGVEGASVRDIVTAAGANLGAINYHFGTKDRLVMEVFTRRLEPINRARVARLDELEKAAGDRPVELSAVVEAFIRPSLEGDPEDPGHGEAVLHLMSRCFIEPNEELKKFVAEQFDEVAVRFDAAILRAVPGLKRDKLLWRMNFLIGALHHGQEMWTRFDRLPRPASHAKDARPSREEFIRQITTFVTAGMREPLPPAPGRRAKRPPRD